MTKTVRILATSNSAEASNKLSAFLRLVGDNLQRCSETLVVVGKPFQQRNALHQFQLHASLKCHVPI